jgi:putative heme-binding domain-containing protein
MGLGIDGPEVLFAGDGAVWRFMDADANGQADGPPTRLFNADFGEHGAHALRKGPDGWWYFIFGNDMKIAAVHQTGGEWPLGKVEAGGLLRFRADGAVVEPYAHGFRNPYDFDFNPAGDIFCYDSDTERDFLLPWYRPTRLYHLAPYGHHGWRLGGHTRSWPRPSLSPDTVEHLADIGRGSPTGVTVYRHFQFPPYYRNGVFALDWTFGRVHFAPLSPDGASYDAPAEVFLEPMGTHGFAPTDAVVGPDGALYISIGGRKTRGSIYRVLYNDISLAAAAREWTLLAASEVEAVLRAPQPFEAWSRAFWVPLAARLGPEPFERAVTDTRVAPELRVRAIEVLTELFDGLPVPVAGAAARANAPFVRARVAWSLGRVPNANPVPLLLALAQDPAPAVRCRALEALTARIADVNPAALTTALAPNFAHPEKRVRLAAARLATSLAEPDWRAFQKQQLQAAPQSRLTAVMASLWRGPLDAARSNAIDSALGVLTQSRLAGDRLQALRLIQLALGDARLQNPPLEVHTGYSPAVPLGEGDPLAGRIGKAAGALLPSGDASVDAEAARVLAMIEAGDAALPGKLLALIGDRSAATDDFHFLAALSRLQSPLPSNALARVARAIVSLDRKLDGLQLRVKQTWSDRLVELTGALLRRAPALAEALLREPDFARAGNLPLAQALGPEHYPACARRFLPVAQRGANFPWSAELIDVLSVLPPEEVLPLFRRQWPNLALRDRLALELARRPEAADRDKFIEGLASTQPATVRACLSALLQLPADKTATPAALRVLRASLSDPKQEATRAQALALLSHLTGQPFKIQEKGPDLKAAYQPVFDWFAAQMPTVLSQLDVADRENAAVWERTLRAVPWQRGDAARGEAIFIQRGCLACHAGNTPLGPDLAGAAARMSPTDLFNAILFPNRDVAPAFRMTEFRLRNGESHLGLVAFEAADGVLLRTGAATTVRLAEEEIASRAPGALSLMPAGLLAGLTPPQLADLYAYLKTLQPAP